MVRQRLERARFFELADLYRQCRASAQETGARYAETEVEAEARTLLAEIDAALDALSGPDTSTTERLKGVLDAIKESESPTLYQHVKGALDETPPDGDS